MQSLRTIAIAYREIDYTIQVNHFDEEFLESQLSLIAIAGIQDPLRPEICEAVKAF